MHTSLTHARVSGWGFGVGFRGGVVMTCAPHGNVARHSKDTSTCTLLYLETSGFRGGASGWGFGVSGWGPDDMRPAWKRGTPQQGHFHMHTPLFGDFRVSGWGFGVGFRGFGVGFRGGVLMTCAPHGNVARHSKDTSTCTVLYLETSGFRGGVSGWGRDDVRPAWKRGTPKPRHFHMHTPRFGVGLRGGASGWGFGVSGWGFGVDSGWGFGVGFRGFGLGFRGGVVMPCAPHGNVARHSKDTSTCTLLYLETSGFRGGVSGWGRDGVMTKYLLRNALKLDDYASGHGMWNQHSKQTWNALEKMGCYPQLRRFSFFALQNIYSEMLQYSTTMPVSMECEINTQNKPGSPWRKLIAIHNFVASAFLHYKISTQKWFKFRRLCQWPWNVKSTLKTNLDRLGENWLLSTTS